MVSINLPSSFHLVEDYDSLNIGDSIMVANSWFNDTTTANNFIITPALTFINNGNYLNFEASLLMDPIQKLFRFFVRNTAEKDSLLSGFLVFDKVAAR